MKTTVPPAQPEASSRQRFTPKPKDAWMKLVGREQDDAAFRDAMRRGEEWRKKMNSEGE